MKWVRVKAWGSEESPYDTWFDFEVTDDYFAREPRHLYEIKQCENLLKAGGYKFWTIAVDV